MRDVGASVPTREQKPNERTCHHRDAPPFPAEPQVPTLQPCVPAIFCARAPRVSTARPATSSSTPCGRCARALITHGHSDHARAGHGAVLATRADARHHGACATATTSPARRRRPRSARRSRQRRRGHLPSRPAMCSARRRSPSSTAARASSSRATTSGAATRPARRSSRSPATSSSPRRPSACRSSAIPPDADEIARLLALGRAVSRAHASRRRLCARQGAAGHRACCARPAMTGRSTSTARWRSSATTTQSQGIDLGDLRPATVEGGRRATSPAPSSSARPRPSPTAGRGASPIRSPCFASGWMRVRQRAKQRGVELPLVISDHADWDELTATIARDRRRARSGSRMAARRRWCAGASCRASPRGRCTSSATRTRGTDADAAPSPTSSTASS